MNKCGCDYQHQSSDKGFPAASVQRESQQQEQPGWGNERQWRKHEECNKHPYWKRRKPYSKRAAKEDIQSGWDNQQQTKPEYDPANPLFFRRCDIH
jgi:hypothetical protein